MKQLVCKACYFLFLLLTSLSSCKKAKVPSVTTSEIANISGHSATSGGIIISEGTDFVVEKGVLWSNETTPGIGNNKTSDGDGTDDYISSITDLNAATTYFARAYATNSAGTGFGTVLTFTTLGQIPTASTEEPTIINATSAILNGTVNANFLSTVVQFEYGVETNYGNTIIATQSPVDDDSLTYISANITGLSASTLYHFRVKTMNELGINYGSDLSFTTPGQTPSVTTQPATNVSMKYADLNGIINANFLDSKTTFEYGLTSEYGTSVTPVHDIVSGNANKAIRSHLTGLPPGTLFHFRVKATNELGTAFGNDLTFTTLGQLPTAITKDASGVSTTSAYLFGSVKSNLLPGKVIFEYGTSTFYGNEIVAMQSPLNGDTLAHLISALVTGLNPDFQYHFRIKAVNELGTAYGEDMTFITTPAVIDIDGNVYSTVRIGSQLWMAENLRTTRYNDGINIPLVTLFSEWWGVRSPGFCWSNNDEAQNKATYGAYYNWYAINSSNVCPTGWHIPSDPEWSVLRISYNRFSDIVVIPTEQGNSHYHFEYWILANETGFRALPGGLRYDTDFELLGYMGYWWSSTEAASNTALTFELTYGAQHVVRDKRIGLSVRCLKD